MKLLYMTNLLKYFNRKKVCFRHVQQELIPSGFSYFDKLLRHLPWFCCTPFEKRQNLSHLWNIIVSQIFNIDWCKNQLILNYLLHFIMYIWSKTDDYHCILIRQSFKTTSSDLVCYGLSCMENGHLRMHTEY
jgi:hypothetical protein